MNQENSFIVEKFSKFTFHLCKVGRTTEINILQITDSTYMSREKILKTAVNLFALYGIKGVSMNQIASALQMSKKTLYAEFDNKEDMLLECLRYEEDRMVKVIRKTEEEAQNSLESLILGMSNMYHYRSSFCPAFFRDIQRYAEAQEMVLSTKIKQHDLYMKYFAEGIKEGYFQPDFEYEVIASLFIEQLGDWDNIQQPYIILTFLRGICTEKGIEVLNSFVPMKVQP